MNINLLNNNNTYQLAVFELYKALRVSDESSEEMQQLVSALNINIDETLNLESLVIANFPQELKKSTFKQALNICIDRILLINGGFPKNQTLGFEYYSLNKLLVLAKIMNTFSLRTASIVVAEELVTRAKKYFFLNLCFEGYRILYSASIQLGDIKSFERASGQFTKYLEYYHVEKSIEIESIKLRNLTSSSALVQKDLIAKIETTINRYSPYENIIPSFYFHYFYYHLQYLIYSYSKEHDKLYQSAKTALKWFESLKFMHLPGRVHFATIQIVYLIQIREYDQAIPIIKKNKFLLKPYSIPWYRTIEKEIIIYFHKGDFEKGVQVFFESQNKSTHVSRDRKSQSTWLLYEAYVNLLLETDSASYDGRKKRFSIQKFINNLPEFSKDKRAHNIPILIAQMLFFIVRKQYNKAIDRIESLDKYASRYLRNDETFRSNCFIKMLLEIPKNSFNQLRVERAAEKYFRRLLDSDIDLIDQPFEIEIIPYERLWAIIMNHLRPDHNYTPKKPRNPVLQ